MGRAIQSNNAWISSLESLSLSLLPLFCSPLNAVHLLLVFMTDDLFRFVHEYTHECVLAGLCQNRDFTNVYHKHL